MEAAVQYAIIDGRRVAYRDRGDGPTIVFLHGLGGNSASWQQQFEALSNSYRVVGWDMPGFGESEGPSGSGADRPNRLE